MPPPKKPQGTLEQRAAKREADLYGHVPTGMTRTGNREVNTLIGGEATTSRPTGSGDFIRDLLFGGGGGDGGGTPGGGDSSGDGDEARFMAEYEELLKRLGEPLDMNDPLVQNILQGARTTTLADLAGRGVHGGYSELNAQQAYINSAARMQQQKTDSYLNALNAAGNYEQRANAARMEQDRWKYDNDPARGIGGLIGGGLGALAGGVGGFFAGGGPASLPTALPAALQGAGWGSQAGSQIGTGIGGFFAPQPSRSRGSSGPYRGGY